MRKNIEAAAKRAVLFYSSDEIIHPPFCLFKFAAVFRPVADGKKFAVGKVVWHIEMFCKLYLAAQFSTVLTRLAAPSPEKRYCVAIIITSLPHSCEAYL